MLRPLVSKCLLFSDNTSRLELITKRSIERNDIDSLWYRRYRGLSKKAFMEREILMTRKREAMKVFLFSLCSRLT